MFIKVTTKNTKPQRVEVRIVKTRRSGHRATIGHSLFINPAQVKQFKRLAGRA